MSEVVVTRHGGKRARGRIGLPKKAVKRELDRVLRYGKRRDDVAGSLRRYMDALHFKTIEHGKNPDVVLYGNNIYIFAKNDEAVFLITTFVIPGRFRRLRKHEDQEDKTAEA